MPQNGIDCSELLRPLSNVQRHRVLLINPHQSYPARLAREYQSYLPVGIAQLAAVLECAGVTTRIRDTLAYDQTTTCAGSVAFGLATKA